MIIISYFTNNRQAVARAVFVCTWLIAALLALIHNSIPHFYARMQNLKDIRNALEDYRSRNGIYPVHTDPSGYDPNIGGKSGSWIPELSPRWMFRMPVDPLGSKLPNHQYLYFSDGTDYKLIAHGAEDAPAVARSHPTLDDPRRPAVAYGFWTSGARMW